MFPIIPANSATAASGNDEGIFGYGYAPGVTSVSITNLVSNAGVVATDTTGVGTARNGLAACEYGGDKGIFGYGAPGPLSITNLVSNAGVVTTDVTGVGTARYAQGACGYGGDKGIFGYGSTGSAVSMTNLVSNAGVVATDVTGVGTARLGVAACEYGDDKGIFGYGSTADWPWVVTAVTNLVSNAGVVATDTTGVGTVRTHLPACSYGDDKGIFGYGAAFSAGAVYLSMSNLVSNAGVVATDTTGVGTGRNNLGACEYGGDKGIFGYGAGVPGSVSITNLVSNAGVVTTDVTGVGTARYGVAACSFN